MPRGLQLVIIVIGLVAIGILLFYIWRQARAISEHRLRQKNRRSFGPSAGTR